MRTPRVLCVFLACSVLLALPALLAAQSPTGKLDYSAKPQAVDTRLSGAELAWLNQVFDLMGSSDFTFIYRIDPDHWMGLFRERLAMVLQIHDGTAGFDYRAQVDRKTGQMRVQKGSAYAGQDRQKSAQTAAGQAIGYLQRVLDNPGIFAARGDDTPAASQPVVSTARKPEGTEDPLSRLMEGNRRFAKGMLIHANQGVDRREEVAKGQHPFAIVLTCSDSRLPPEILFDQGLGDLFVVRTAGEVVGALEIGSIEYAAEHLHATHLMILGHEKCGAVDATVKGGEFSDAIARIALQIQPAVAAAKGMTGDLLDNAIRQNVLLVRKAVLQSPVLEDLMHEKQLSVSTAYYDLDTGMVSLIDPSESRTASGGMAPEGRAAPAKADY